MTGFFNGNSLRFLYGINCTLKYYLGKILCYEVSIVLVPSTAAREFENRPINGQCTTTFDFIYKFPLEQRHIRTSPLYDN